MLQFTRKVEYALALVSLMNRAPAGTLHSARLMSEHSGIPFDMVTKSLQRLNRCGFCEAVQGKNGGYRLVLDVHSLSLRGFISALGSPVALVDCMAEDHQCQQYDSCCLVAPMRRLNRHVERLLDAISLGEFFAGDPLAATQSAGCGSDCGRSALTPALTPALAEAASPPET